MNEPKDEIQINEKSRLKSYNTEENLEGSN